MKSSTLLRTCVIACWLLISAQVYLYPAFKTSLPLELRSWEPVGHERGLSFSLGLILEFTGTAVGGGIFIGTAGLLMLRRWGAWFFVISIVAGSALRPFFGPSVQPSMTVALEELRLLLSGFVIGIAFFTDALHPKEEPLQAVEEAVCPPSTTS
jgi:hypothetical protein